MSTAEYESPVNERVKVLLWCRYGDAEQLRDAERRFDQIGEVLRGTPGLTGSQLLISAQYPGSFAVLSEWASLTAFRTWEQGGEHRSQTAGMRPFQDPDRTPGFDVLEVIRVSGA